MGLHEGLWSSRPLYSQGKNPRYPSERSLGGSHCQYGRVGEEKNTCPYREYTASLELLLLTCLNFPWNVILIIFLYPSVLYISLFILTQVFYSLIIKLIALYASSTNCSQPTRHYSSATISLLLHLSSPFKVDPLEVSECFFQNYHCK
jgi:hypothetical protein